MSDASVDALVSQTLYEIAWDLPVDLIPRNVARYAVEVTLRAVADDDTTPDDLAQTRTRALADGRLAAFADATDLTPLLANRSGLADPAGELHGIAKDLTDPRWAETLNRVARAIRGEDETDEQ